MATLLVILLFIRVNWPQGLQLAMIFVALACAFNALIPLQLIRGKVLLSLLIAPVIAGALYFGVMRYTSQFVQLAPWLVVVFFPLLYLMSSPNPKTSMTVTASSVFILLLIALGEDQSYSFSSFVNNWIGLCGGFGVTIAVLGLFDRLTPEQEFTQQIRSFFGWCDHSMQDLGSVPQTTTPPWTRAGRRRWRTLLKKLRMWAGAVDSRRRPDATRLIDSLEHVTLRLGATEHAWRTQSTEPLNHLYGTFAESFRRMERSVSRREPVAAPLDTSVPLEDFGAKAQRLLRSTEGVEDTFVPSAPALGMAATLQSLAQAIQDCRDNVNAIDWDVWNRNRF